MTNIAGWRQDQEISNRAKETSRPTAVARHLLLLILIISEAARFPDIERTITCALNYTQGGLTPQQIYSLTHQWESLSRLGAFPQVALKHLSSTPAGGPHSR
ncbi:MAG: hypothetical protein JOY64_10500 [Alphaproteobacteria bacterium]|nr:hypothetical protein [Alphaproteobacteria bacterium]MBV8408049.1 hypothetical protein [Alphaproteobacteria bacterium]